MNVTKAVLLAVLRTRHADDRPILAQQLPDRFDTDDFRACSTGWTSLRTTW